MTDTLSPETTAQSARTGRSRRDLAALGLITSAVLMAISTILTPPWGDSATQRLTSLNEAGASATISAVTFTLAQLPLLAGVLGIGHLLRARSPRLSTIGTCLAVIGCFGHAVAGGIGLVTLSMAADTANLEVQAQLADSLENGATIPFMAAGLLGTVLGILLLSIGLFRSGVGPRWVGPTLWLFLVVEFVGSNLSDWASLAAVVLYALALGAVAVTMHRTPAAAWALPEEPSI